jgi:hypothetical protein
MNHDEAVQLMIAEKYLLNELSPDVRDQFEEHFFDCMDCANDVRAGAVFVEKSKAVLGERPALIAARTPGTGSEKAGWMVWLRPAFTLPVMAVLLAVIAYQSLTSHVRPQVLASASLNISARGSASPAIAIRQGEGFLLLVNITPSPAYSSYVADMYDPDGKVEWSIKIPASTTQDQWPVQVPGANRKPGNYGLEVRGISGSGESNVIGRRSFELQIGK